LDWIKIGQKLLGDITYHYGDPFHNTNDSLAES